MKKRNGLVITTMVVLAGCTMVPQQNSEAPLEIGNVPEAVAALAAPGQDLDTARRLPEDGCYWYVHSGPVETTMVPLRAEGGNPICTTTQS